MKHGEGNDEHVMIHDIDEMTKTTEERTVGGQEKTYKQLRRKGRFADAVLTTKC